MSSRSAFAVSSVRGLVKNAYDLTKGSGGSSTGTGTAIGASLALLGTGSDTGGSFGCLPP